MNKMILILFFLFAGCSSSLVISPKFCPGNLNFNKIRNPDYEFEKRIWTNFGNKKKKVILVSKLLKEEGYQCKDLKSVNYKVESRWLDGFVSLFPYLGSKVVVVSIKRGRGKP